ncbi:MAG: ROK family protein, partial [Lachnospiraceae bacterium]|nr:ROK family protein [Lachnospiraceae bacterium]
LREQLQVPVYVENDANCAAMGEYLAGAGRGSRQMIMVTFGTGIGGGIIFDGKLYLGRHGNSNIIGHIQIEKGGRECTCKRKGCWECYASTRALLLSAKQAGVFAGVDDGEINGHLFFEALKEKKEAALCVFEEYTDYVAEGIADLINIFDPERIVIGGGVSAQGELLLAPVREKVKQKIYFKEMETADIVCSVLANDAAVIGAANLLSQ